MFVDTQRSLILPKLRFKPVTPAPRSVRNTLMRGKQTHRAVNITKVTQRYAASNRPEKAEVFSEKCDVPAVARTEFNRKHKTQQSAPGIRLHRDPFDMHAHFRVVCRFTCIVTSAEVSSANNSCRNLCHRQTLTSWQYSATGHGGISRTWRQLQTNQSDRARHLHIHRGSRTGKREKETRKAMHVSRNNEERSPIIVYARAWVCACVRMPVSTGMSVCFRACSLTNTVSDAITYCHLRPLWLPHTARYSQKIKSFWT